MDEIEEILHALGLQREDHVLRVLATVKANAEMAGTINTMTKIAEMQRDELVRLRTALAEHEKFEIESDFLLGAAYGLRLACKILGMPEGAEPQDRSPFVQAQLDAMLPEEDEK